MKVLHICAGWEQWNGAANIARMIMDEQVRAGHAVTNRTWASIRKLRAADEVWIHCSWMPCLWWAALWGKKFRWMPECSYDPVRRAYHGWKKWLVGPIERYFLRRADRIVATCEAEKGWIEAYLGKRCPPIEVMDIKRFFKISSEFRVQSLELGAGKNSRVDRVEGEISSHKEHKERKGDGRLHLLYLGRRHPLKGLEYLEEAVKSLEFRVQSSECRVPGSECRVPGSEFRVGGRECVFRMESNVFGEEKERVWAWCDVLVLPTLSENFGLVVAEALERGKRVITTDGAPAWGEEGNGEWGMGNGSHVERVERVEEGNGEWGMGNGELEGACIRMGYGGRLLYLVGYREGSEETRVRLLKEAIGMLKERG